MDKALFTSITQIFYVSLILMVEDLERRARGLNLSQRRVSGGLMPPEFPSRIFRRVALAYGNVSDNYGAFIC